MNVPAPVAEWSQQQGHGQVTGVKPVAGGCINNGARIETGSGASFFLKQNPQAPSDMFRREAEALRELAIEGGPVVPKPLLVEAKFLLLEDLNPGPKQPDYWPSFGRRLAGLHQKQNDQFGFDHDNYLGSTPQPNPWTRDGFEFFAEHRLLFQAHLAQENRHFTADDFKRVEALAKRLPDLIPEQPAALIHGDLWSGNAIADSQGRPAIIDPAAHYGWPEAELGMTKLFGGFPAAFYDAYQEIQPLAEGWRERLPLYNLYHLLNHLNIFGSSYSARVQSVLSRFGP
ncbi:MAG: fructosamine kinase family protein [Anaerolineales bacterium]